MKETVQAPKSERDRNRVVVVVLLLPVAYILSVGPAAWLCQHGFLPGRFVERIYAPLDHINGSGKESWLMWYLELWKS